MQNTSEVSQREGKLKLDATDNACAKKTQLKRARDSHVLWMVASDTACAQLFILTNLISRQEHPMTFLQGHDAHSKVSTASKHENAMEIILIEPFIKSKLDSSILRQCAPQRFYFRSLRSNPTRHCSRWSSSGWCCKWTNHNCEFRQTRNG